MKKRFKSPRQGSESLIWKSEKQLGTHERSESSNEGSESFLHQDSF